MSSKSFDPHPGVTSKFADWWVFYQEAIVKHNFSSVIKKVKVNDLFPSNTKKPEENSSPGTRNEGTSDNIRSNDDQLTELNSLPDGGIKWRRIGKILVSSKIIGKGSNGTIIYEGQYDKRPAAAVKRLLRNYHQVAYKEIDKLIASDWAENIVRYYGVEQDDDFVYLALEHCTCSLDDLIRALSDSSNNEFLDDQASMDDYKIKLDYVRDIMQDVNLWSADNYPSPQLLKLMRDVVLGLNQLHDLRLIHRDLKPNNVLITKYPFGAKLSDMGMSTFLPDGRSSLGSHATSCGTKGWRAPEQILHSECRKQAMDLFSLGCVLFFCITGGQHPFGANRKREDNIAQGNLDLFLVNDMPEAYHLLSCLLSHEPESRPKASEVLRHPFFWSSEMRLDFFHDVSDKIKAEEDEKRQKELEDEKPKKNRKMRNKKKKLADEKRKNKLEDEPNFPKVVEDTAPLIFKGTWTKKIHPNIMGDLERFGTYDGTRVKSLLRAVRNKVNHRREVTEEVEGIHGRYPDGLDAYFAEKFPRLLIELYKVAYEFCKNDTDLGKYFLFGELK
ncbi:hypothetical protein EUGRSUZ_C02048 [Eucalyptus grandis]|uniref:Uncharacterized protein n=2 Tax=Eucalyptus grandis TaxID=71139 RepID=A0ACC3LEP2_EUCGR|nr:hypothetical protein EUGRSUZ_C02048 [Eucalyptus grandis]